MCALFIRRVDPTHPLFVFWPETTTPALHTQARRRVEFVVDVYIIIIIFYFRKLITIIYIACFFFLPHNASVNPGKLIIIL